MIQFPVSLSLSSLAAYAYFAVALFSLQILYRRDPIPPHAKLMNGGGTGRRMELNDIALPYRAMYSVSKGVLGMMMTALFAAYSVLFGGVLSAPDVTNAHQIAAWWVCLILGLLTYPWYIAIALRTGKRFTENGYRWPLLALIHTLALASLVWHTNDGVETVITAPIRNQPILLFWSIPVPAFILYCAVYRTYL